MIGQAAGEFNPRLLKPKRERLPKDNRSREETRQQCGQTARFNQARRRRRIRASIPAPPITIAQVPGSGTAV